MLRSDKRIKHTVLRPAGLTNDPAGDAKILIRKRFPALATFV